MAEEEKAIQEVPVEQTAQEDVASLKTQIADLQKKADDAFKEAKAHQSNFTKTQQELRKSQDISSRIETLAAQMEVLGEALAVTGKRMVTDNTGEAEQPAIDVKKRMAEASTKITQARLAELARQADREAYKGGYDIETAPELTQARQLFQRGLPEEGLEEVRKMVAGKGEAPKKPAKSVDELTDGDREEIARKYMEAKGMLKTDTGAPSGKLQDWAAIQQNYIDGKINVTEYSAERKKRGIV